MRVRKKSWTESELETNPKLIGQPEDWKGNWHSFFQNSNPIYVEIGCGKGRFIIENSLRNPDINFIALEKEKHVIVSGMRQARELSLNLGFILGNVDDLAEFFAPGEIGRLYINFCDPWPNRKKWEKRRLTHKNYLQVYEQLLGQPGEVHLKTDNAQLFEFSLNEFSNEGWRLRNISLDLHNSGFEENIMTEYEEKFSGQGLPIYRCEAIKNER